MGKSFRSAPCQKLGFCSRSLERICWWHLSSRDYTTFETDESTEMPDVEMVSFFAFVHVTTRIPAPPPCRHILRDSRSRLHVRPQAGEVTSLGALRWRYSSQHVKVLSSVGCSSRHTSVYLAAHTHRSRTATPDNAACQRHGPAPALASHDVCCPSDAALAFPAPDRSRRDAASRSNRSEAADSMADVNRTGRLCA